MAGSVKKARKKAEVVFVMCIFLFVIGCSSIPIFIYATSADINARQDDLGVGLDLINCSQQVSAWIVTMADMACPEACPPAK